MNMETEKEMERGEKEEERDMDDDMDRQSIQKRKHPDQGVFLFVENQQSQG